MNSDSATTPLAGNLLLCRSWPVDTDFGRFEAHEFRNLHTHGWAIAMTLALGESVKPILSRVHSSCVTSETFGGCDCDCAQQLGGAMAAIAEEGRGVVFYLMQEGRGAGLTAKARDRMLVQASEHRLTTFEAYERLGLPPDGRRYGEVPAMCGLLGIEAPLILLTNNLDKVAALEREKVRIHATRSLRHPPSPFNRHYLKAKSVHGHSLVDTESDSSIAEPPKRVRWMDPVAVPGSSLLQMASYFLPVRAVARPEPVWFQLSLYFDAKVGTERVVLELSPEVDEEIGVRIQPQVVLERFPLRDVRHRKDWMSAVSRFAEAGSGIGVFLPATLADHEVAPVDGVSRLLVTRHLRGRRGRLLVNEPGAPASGEHDLDGVEIDETPLRDIAGGFDGKR